MAKGPYNDEKPQHPRIIRVIEQWISYKRESFSFSALCREVPNVDFLEFLIHFTNP